jgi:hypothetical protein
MCAGLGEPAALNISRCSATFLCSPRLIDLSERNPSARTSVANGGLPMELIDLAHFARTSRKEYLGRAFPWHSAPTEAI